MSPPRTDNPSIIFLACARAPRKFPSEFDCFGLMTGPFCDGRLFESLDGLVESSSGGMMDGRAQEGLGRVVHSVDKRNIPLLIVNGPSLSRSIPVAY